MYIGQLNLKERSTPFLIICKHQALFPFMPCPACKGNHPYFNIFPGRNFCNIYKHWPVTQMEDFLQWVPAGEDVGKVATHTSFMDVNFAMRRRADDFVPTPAPGTTWYMLVGATESNIGGSAGAGLEEIAHSYQSPAQIEVRREPGEHQELHRGRVLLEGYDFSLRAYTFRKQGEDRVELIMTPKAPQINPVFLINGWSAPGVRVRVDGGELAPERFRAQVKAMTSPYGLKVALRKPRSLPSRPSTTATLTDRMQMGYSRRGLARSAPRGRS
jgi:hypothetical protein